MSKNNKLSNELKKQVEDIKKIRGSWGGISPITRVAGSKSKDENKRKKEEKHKGRRFLDER